MALLCYNKGCGQRFDLDKNSQGSCVYHPGVPIFHDALKGWSCCKKRTTDFSEFLSIKGCTKGCHSSEKPPEPFSQVGTSDKLVAKLGRELIVQGPKSAEKMQRERPSSDELRQQLPLKVSRSLEQVLEKLNLTSEDQPPKGGFSCQAEAVPEDWHQTSSQVVVTVYAKNPLPALSFVKANRTVVIEVEKSFVNMVPTKVEITLSKASPMPWGKLEHPHNRSQVGGEQPEKHAVEAEAPQGAHWEDSDDTLSWSEEEDEEGVEGAASK